MTLSAVMRAEQLTPCPRRSLRQSPTGRISRTPDRVQLTGWVGMRIEANETRPAGED